MFLFHLCYFRCLLVGLVGCRFRSAVIWKLASLLLKVYSSSGLVFVLFTLAFTALELLDTSFIFTVTVPI